MIKKNNVYELMFCKTELPSAAALMEGIEYILDESDLLTNYGIHDEIFACKLMRIINAYTSAV